MRIKAAHQEFASMVLIGDRAGDAGIVAKFSIESTAGFGTAITLTVPGCIIYRKVN
jgi:hypothetical protein